MFGQINRFEIKPDVWLEFDRAFRDRILPILKKQRGFIEEIRMASDAMGSRKALTKNAMESKHKPNILAR